MLIKTKLRFNTHFWSHFLRKKAYFGQISEFAKKKRFSDRQKAQEFNIHRLSRLFFA